MPGTGRGSIARMSSTRSCGFSRETERVGYHQPRMTARLALVRGRVLPNGWVDLLRQCSLFGGAYLLYRLVEGVVGGNTSVAFAHARELISLERGMHIFVEPTIQGWATSSHLLV